MCSVTSELTCSVGGSVSSGAESPGSGWSVEHVQLSYRNNNWLSDWSQKRVKGSKGH